MLQIVFQPQKAFFSKKGISIFGQRTGFFAKLRQEQLAYRSKTKFKKFLISKKNISKPVSLQDLILCMAGADKCYKKLKHGVENPDQFLERVNLKALK